MYHNKEQQYNASSDKIRVRSLSRAYTSGNPDFLLHFHKDEDDDCYEQNRTKINAKVFRVVKQSCVVVVAAGTNRDVAAVVAVSVVAFSGALSF